MLTRKLPLLIEAASGSHQSDEFWKGESLMFARIVEFIPKPEKKEEFVKKVRDEVLPILKTQKGFLEILPFFPENKAEKVITITLWMEKWDVEKYEREVYPKVEEILKPIHSILESRRVAHASQRRSAPRFSIGGCPSLGGFRRLGICLLHHRQLRRELRSHSFRRITSHPFVKNAIRGTGARPPVRWRT